MKRLLLMFCMICCLSSTWAQTRKPNIDTSIYGTWPSVRNDLFSSFISNDGKYVIYRISNHPQGMESHGVGRLFIQSTDASWKSEVQVSKGIRFTNDSRYAVYMKGKDSLSIMNLGKPVVEYIPMVLSFTLPERGDWWVYLLSSPAKELVVRSLRSKKEQRFTEVNRYWLAADGKNLYVEKDAVIGTSSVKKLNCINLATGQQKEIWKGRDLLNLLFDEENNLAFTAIKNDGNTTKDIWYYAGGMDSAKLVLSESSTGLQGLKIDGLNRFSKDGKRLFFTLNENKPLPSKAKAKPGMAKVTVWSYNDTILQSAQSDLGRLLPVYKSTGYLAVVNLENKTLFRLEKNMGELSIKSSDLVFLTNTLVPGADGFEQYWNKSASKPLCLVSAVDGSRKDLSIINNRSANVSDGDKYVLYWNPGEKNYFTYEVGTGTIRNITAGIVADWILYKDDEVQPRTAATAFWLPGDEWVLLYSRFDIWKVDPSGKRPPVNLTNGYGERNRIVLRLGLNTLTIKSQLATNTKKLIVNGYDWHSKDNGFYSIDLDKEGDPALLTMGPFIYEHKQAPVMSSGTAPVKARDAGRYIVQRMSATEFPNLYSTTDFKKFIPLTDLHPEKDFNWLTTELHNWTDLKGDSIQGILFKPENFDSTKKYPVIFHYYEKRSQRLNQYLEPKFGEGIFEIPWYVSNGYLVFCPDIQITLGEQGESAVNAVVSAAKYLAQKPYVNADKMGITGFSYGGYETYYLVTHSKLFAAACAGAGLTDFISLYGQVWGNGLSDQTLIEEGQIRMNATLWERPDLYIKNSPVIQAHQVSAPILMYQNTNDGIAPFSQALEFYLAMRRLGKRAWLLEYAEGNHNMPGVSAPDISLRMQQFFGHYLKDEPAPKWMLEGIPARKKGIEDGLELVKEKDKNGKWLSPGGGLLPEDQQKKPDALRK
jgi:dipeptidyl aminopeptidase/acylaminoacyl peptidase